MKGYWICALILAAPTAALADPTGKWRVGDGTANVQIRHCGPALCGSIIWTPNRGGRGENNPNPAKRNRRLLGLPMLNLKPAGDNIWTGTVYNAKDGQNYAARLNLENENRIKLEGCVPETQVCGEESWTRIR